MRCAAIVYMLLAIMAMSLFARITQAEPKYRERVEYFDISSHIESRQEVWQAIHNWGPSLDFDKTIVGLIKQRIGYNYKLEQRGNSCRFRELNVAVNVVIRLPGWELKQFAQPDLQHYYQCILNTVTAHEKRHAQISYEAGAKIETQFYAKLNGSQCKGFAERAEQIYYELIDEHGRRQADFDRRDYAKKRYKICDKVIQGSLVNSNNHSNPYDFDVQNTSESAVNKENLVEKKIISTRKNKDTVLRDGDIRNDFSFEAIKNILEIAMYFVIAAILLCGLFVAVMLSASQYEKRREYTADSNDFSQPDLRRRRGGNH